MLFLLAFKNNFGLNSKTEVSVQFDFEKLLRFRFDSKIY